MGFIVLNPENLSQFEHAHEPTELRDSGGRVVGMFHPVKPPRVRSNLTREELEERRRDKSGKPLAEFFPPRMAQP